MIDTREIQIQVPADWAGGMLRSIFFLILLPFRPLIVLMAWMSDTYLSSDELALLIQLPKEEVPGYAVSDLARFDKVRYHLHQPLNRELPSVAGIYISLGQYLSIPDFSSYGLRMSKFGGPDPTIYQAALQFLSRQDSQRIWARIIARTIFSRNALPKAITHLHQQIAANPGHLTVSQFNEALIMVIVFGVAWALQDRGSEKGWPFPIADSMRISLTAGLITLVKTNDLKPAALDLDRFVRAYEANMKRQWGPYPGCQSCRAICFYQAEVRRLLSSIDQGDIRSIRVSPAFKNQQEKYLQLSKRLESIVIQWLGGSGTEIGDIGYCTALVAAAAMGSDEYEQADFGQELARKLLG